ncbi:hypothetical protein [Orenia metallireducens]|uniref:hypothetical protein n=1 Tax=Orenia metallireducens TaxID=1413210 RepID=UPI000BE3D40B|nr:hypothetical protein [Orenia metallireducens]
MTLKEDEESRKSIIIKTIIDVITMLIFGFLFFYLPREYNKYLILVLVFISIIKTYKDGNDK